MTDDSPTTPRARPKKPRKPRAPSPKPTPVSGPEPSEGPPDVVVVTPEPDEAGTDPGPAEVVEDALPEADPEAETLPAAQSPEADPEPEAETLPPAAESLDASETASPEPSPTSDVEPADHLESPDPPEPPTLPATPSLPVSPAPARTDPVTLAQALATDGVRRVIVTVAYVFCLIGALTAFGMMDRTSANGPTALSPTLSLLAPASQGGRIWWVVLLGLGGYVGWLWLPRTTVDVRARAVAYRAAVAMSLLGLWLFLARTTWLVGSAIVGVLVVAALMAALRVASRVPSRSFVARQAVQLGLAVTLGWMTVVASGAVAGALVTRHVPAYLVSAETWGILATTAVFAAGMALLRYNPGRLYIAAALAWGFFWIAYARTLGQPRSYLLAAVAGICALLILIAGVAVFLWARGRVRERVN